MQNVRIIGLAGMPLIKPGDRLGYLIVEAAERMGESILDDDVIVVAHVAVAKAEGCVIDADSVAASDFAKHIAALTGKDPRYVEVILRNSKAIVKMRRGVIICETHHGFICANAGVDASNVSGGSQFAPIPPDPDASAARIRREIAELTGKDVAVIVSDTHGRPFRKGTINVAIGCSGIEPLWDRRGERDLYGRVLVSKITCVADEICSAAELVMGQAAEGIPAAIVRGYKYKKSEASAREIIRPEEEDIFR